MHVDVAPINDGSHSFTCHQHVYPRMEGAILRLLPSRRAALHFGRYSVPVRWRVGGWVGLGEPRKTGQLRISWGSVFVRRLPARCRLGSSSSSSVVGQFQVLNYEHQFTSRQSCIFCCWTKNLEQSDYTSPSACQFLPEAEKVFCCSRHQRLVTVAFRRCI